MNPLSISKYYFRNKRRIVPILIIIALSIVCVTVATALTGAISRDMKAEANLYNKYYALSVIPGQIGNEKLNALEEDLDEISTKDDLIKGTIRYLRTNSIVKDIGRPIHYLESNDYQAFMQQVGWELKEGSLPADGQNEMVISEKVAKNRSLKVGDKVGANVDESEWLRGEYMIVGILNEKSNVIGGLASYDYLLTESEVPSDITYYLKPASGKEVTLEENLNSLKKEYPSTAVYTYNSEQNRIDESLETLDLIILAINLIIVIVISTSIALLNIIFFMQRANEFGLLAALGYSKSFIIKRTLFEVIALIIAAWILGLFIAQGIYMFLNDKIYYPKGIEGLTILEPKTLLFSLPIPLAVIIFSLSTVLWKLVRMDPISIIEKRD